MKKLSIEVKTIYNIQIEYLDFYNIFVAAKDDPTLIDAFEDFNLNDTTIGNVRKCFKMLEASVFSDRCNQACKDLKYIVRKLGFDGIENYGGFFKDKTVYSIAVYNNGSDL